jgi:Ca-activated chloride channel family protein
MLFLLNLQFQYPQALWLLAALPLFVLLFPGYQWWRKRAVKRMGDATLVKALILRTRLEKKVFKFLLFLACFCLGLYCGSQSPRPDKVQEEVPGVLMWCWRWM